MSSVSGFNSSTEGEVSSAYDAFFESSYHQELNLQLFVLLSLTINLSIYLCSVSWIHPSHFVFLFLYMYQTRPYLHSN